ncbi:MAG: hypothetical protein COA69_03945 [Robiginitomaculum sp.]|nr:MAG: hypothetical protein COA69_03945 [Robiginitomaculum sp.]
MKAVFSKLKILGFAILGLLVMLFIVIRMWQAEWKPQGKTSLAFTQISLPFSHQYQRKLSLPFVGSSAFDMDGDGIDEIFLGGGRGQADQIFKFTDGKFVKMDIAFPQIQAGATHGAAHLDVDKDGDTDLFTVGESGVWLHLNTGHNTFESRRLEFGMAENTTPLSVALGDVNKDGWVDLYISGYIKNELVEGQTIFTKPYGGYSYLLLNAGDNTWHDVSKEAGVWRQHNTFTAVFADLDNDLDSDLIIAQDTGVIEMYENTGTFPMKPIPSPTVSSYPMGLAVGDYDNDGLVDIYASNVGHTLPAKMLRGDLAKDAPFNTDYILLHNEGGLKFTDTAREAEIARLGFGWGTVFTDLNLDGYADILTAQNYVKLPLNAVMTTYNGKILQNTSSGTFEPVEKTSGATDKAFGITPLISDFNQDGWPDIIWVNIDGPAKAYLSVPPKNAPTPDPLKLPDTVRSLNALVSIQVGENTVLHRQIIATQGLGSDQSRTLFLPASDGSPQIQYQTVEPK